MLLEWTDPPFAPGHWVPEMIVAAGGEPLLGTPGEKSERVTWEPSRRRAGGGRGRAVRLRPDGAAAARRRAGRLRVLPAGVPVHAVDANASWARPGTRLVDGVEELAAILHPDTT